MKKIIIIIIEKYLKFAEFELPTLVGIFYIYIFF